MSSTRSHRKAQLFGGSPIVMLTFSIPLLLEILRCWRQSTLEALESKQQFIALLIKSTAIMGNLRNSRQDGSHFSAKLVKQSVGDAGYLQLL